MQVAQCERGATVARPFDFRTNGGQNAEVSAAFSAPLRGFSTESATLFSGTIGPFLPIGKVRPSRSVSMSDGPKSVFAASSDTVEANPATELRS